MSTQRVRRTPEERYEAAVQRVEKALLSLGNIQGEFDPEIIKATQAVLEERVRSAVGRIRPKSQLTIFGELERRASLTTERQAAEESGALGQAVGREAPGGDDAD